MAAMATQTSSSGELYFTSTFSQCSKTYFSYFFKVLPKQVTKAEDSKNHEKSENFFF